MTLVYVFFRCCSHPRSTWWKSICPGPQERLPGGSCHHQWPPSPWKPLDQCWEPITKPQPSSPNHWPNHTCDRPRLPSRCWSHPLCEQRLRQLYRLHQDRSYWWAQPVLTGRRKPHQPNSDPAAAQSAGKKRARPASERSWSNNSAETSLPVHIQQSRRWCPTLGPSAGACERGPHQASWRPFNRGAWDGYSRRRAAQ